MALAPLRFPAAIIVSSLGLMTSVYAAPLEISSVTSVPANDPSFSFVSSPVDVSFPAPVIQKSDFEQNPSFDKLQENFSSFDDNLSRSHVNQYVKNDWNRTGKSNLAGNGAISVVVEDTVKFNRDGGKETNLWRYAINLKGMEVASKVEITKEGTIKIVAGNSTPAAVNKDLPLAGVNRRINTDVGYNPPGAGTNLPPFDGDNFGRGAEISSFGTRAGDPGGGAGGDLPPDDGDSSQDSPLNPNNMSAKLVLHENFYVRHTLDDSGRFFLNSNIEIDLSSFKGRLFQRDSSISYYLAHAPPVNIHNLLIQAKSRVYLKKTNSLKIGLARDFFYSQKDTFYQAFLAPPEQVPKIS